VPAQAAVARAVFGFAGKFRINIGYGEDAFFRMVSSFLAKSIS
jgi:hypothetical protein